MGRSDTTHTRAYTRPLLLCLVLSISVSDSDSISLSLSVTHTHTLCVFSVLFSRSLCQVAALFSEYEANVKALLTGADETLLKRVPASTNQCRVGFVSDTNSLSPLLLRAVGSVVGELASSGGLAVVAGTLKAAAVLEGLLAEGVNPADATLGYGQCAKTHGEYMASKSGRCCVCTHMFVVVAVGLLLWGCGCNETETLLPQSIVP